MKALKCEMCGSNDVVKQDGYYVCQNCGTKYTVEEARKIMVEGMVNVQGTVKIDHTDELENLYELARRAKDSGNCENALKYYEMIALKDASSWEANFYMVYFKAKSFKIDTIENAASSISKCLQSTFELIRDHVSIEEQEQVVEELLSKTLAIANAFVYAQKSFFKGIDEDKKKKFKDVNNKKFSAVSQMMYKFGDGLEKIFGEKFTPLSVKSWKEGNRILSEAGGSEGFLDFLEEESKTIEKYADKIKKYDPDYEAPTLSSGCGSIVLVAVVVIVIIVIVTHCV